MALLRSLTMSRLYYYTNWHHTLAFRVCGVMSQDLLLSCNNDSRMCVSTTILPQETIISKRWLTNHFEIAIAKPSDLLLLNKEVPGSMQEGNVKKKKKSHRGHFVVTDEKRARYIIHKLKKYFNLNDSTVTIVECNPGDGTLTEKLLLRTQVKVVCLQSGIMTVSDSLKTLQSGRAYQKRLLIHQGHMWDIKSIIDNICYQKNTPQIYGKVKIIGTTFPWRLQASFTNWLVDELATCQAIFGIGFVECFFFVPENELDLLCIPRHCKDAHLLYGTRAVLRAAMFKLFFTVDIVGKMYAKDFKNYKGLLKHFKMRKKQKNTTETCGNARIYLIRLMPALDLYDWCTHDDLPKLVSLVKLLRKHRNQPVLEALEYLSAGASSALESAGFTSTQLVSHLTRQHIIDMHQILLQQQNYLNINTYTEKKTHADHEEIDELTEKNVQEEDEFLADIDSNS